MKMLLTCGGDEYKSYRFPSKYIFSIILEANYTNNILIAIYIVFAAKGIFIYFNNLIPA